MLESEGIPYVCWAVEAAGAYLGKKCVARAIVKRIRRSIAPHETVTNWLYDQGLRTPAYITSAARQYRLAWIDWMIEGYRGMK